MIKFLAKYRFAIIVMIVLTILLFYFIPSQEKIYLKPDFELIKAQSRTVLIWTSIILSIVIFILAVKGVKKTNEFINVCVGVLGLVIPFYLFFDSIFLSGFLLLNRINAGVSVEKKYTAAYFLGRDKESLLLYDFTTKKSLTLEHILVSGKIENLKLGDTIKVSFKKGLLGYNFAPEIKGN